MTSQEFLTSIVAKCLDRVGTDERSLLATMIVLHTQDLLLEQSVLLEDVNWGNAEHRLNAITRRHAAEIVADAMSRHGDVEFMDFMHAEYVTKTPFELFESVSEEFMPFVEQIINSFVSDDRVLRLVEPE